MLRVFERCGILRNLVLPWVGDGCGFGFLGYDSGLTMDLARYLPVAWQKGNANLDAGNGLLSSYSYGGISHLTSHDGMILRLQAGISESIWYMV